MRVPPLGFLHPWFLVGLAGAALPLIIHLIGRHRAQEVHFAAFEFLSSVNRRLARREKLRQFLLLLLRMVAIAALVFAVARLVYRPAEGSGQSVDPAKSRHLVLVLDASQSMDYLWQGKTLFTHARERAREVLSHLRPGDAVTLVVAGQETRSAFQAPTLNGSQAAQALESIEKPAGTADLGAGIELGLSQVNEIGPAPTLAVISDLSRNSFKNLRPSSLDRLPPVRLIDPAGREASEPLPNLALLDLRVEVNPDAAQERMFRIKVHNFGHASIRDRPLRLSVDGNPVARGFVTVPRGATVEKTLTHHFETPGLYDVEVRLESAGSDGCAWDDVVAQRIEIRSAVRVLAVNGDPRTTPYEDELFFLERAWEAIPRGDPAIEATLSTAEDLPEIELAEFQAILLANVATLPASEVDRLRDFVRSGGGLLVGLGDRVRFESANQKMGPLLAFPLRDLHRAEDRNASTPAVGIGDVDWDHPVLSGLGRPFETSLQASGTRSYFNLAIGAGTKVRVLLRFDNGAPALVERSEGRGRLMLWATSLDVDLTDLPLRSGFPPLWQRTARYLAGVAPSRGQSGQPATVRIGDRRQILVPTGTQSIAFVAPSAQRREYPVRPSDGYRLQLDDWTEVGTYRAEIHRDGWESAPNLDLAINASLSESDFTPISASEISQRLGGDADPSQVSVVTGPQNSSNPFEGRGYASLFLLLLGGAFVGEGLLAARG